MSDDILDEAAKLMNCNPAAIAIGLTTDAAPGGVTKLAARCREAAGVADIPIFNASEADCDAIVQIGTALPVVALIAEIERETGKPLVACNAAVY